MKVLIKIQIVIFGAINIFSEIFKQNLEFLFREAYIYTGTVFLSIPKNHKTFYNLGTIRYNGVWEAHLV